MADFARTVTGHAGYRVPTDDPSFKGADYVAMQNLKESLSHDGAATGSGGFKLDVDQMRALLPQWQELRDKLDDLRREAHYLRQVTPPAEDEASMAHHQAAVAHADLYQRSIKDQWTYADGYVKALEKMIADYEHGDRSSADVLKNLGAALS